MDTLFFSFDKNENVDERDIFEKGLVGYYDYIEFEKELSNPVGYIVKFIKISPDSIIFSITYFHNSMQLSDYGPFSHWTRIDFKDVLIYTSDSIKNEYEKFINEVVSDRKFSEDFLNKIKFKTEIAMVDVFFEGIVKYSDKRLTIEICPDFRTPFKYKPQSDEFLQKLMKRLKIMKERDLEK